MKDKVANGGSTLTGIRVVEIADERAEYAGLVLAGLGAEVVKIEPPEGSATRRIGPFLDDVPDPHRSLFFWHYNRGKQSIALDLDDVSDAQTARALCLEADVVLDATDRAFLDDRGLSLESLREDAPRLITVRVTPFGDTGPWADWKGSDLIHLALGGPVMNCGYDPLPDGTYDLAPIAPQMWHAYHISGEQVAMMVVAALVERDASGLGQHLSCAIHEAVAKATEIDLMSWIMRAVKVERQTCRHAAENRSVVPSIAYTKDGRWIINQPQGNVNAALEFADQFGLGDSLRSVLSGVEGNKTGASGRDIPGSSGQTEAGARMQETLQRVMSKFAFANAPWKAGQEAGLWMAPLRKPYENVDDEHWQKRGTFSEIHYPELRKSFVDVTSKWISEESPWLVGRRAPLLDEDHAAILSALALRREESASRSASVARREEDPDGSKPFALEGIRIFDFSWFLATAGGTRFMAALGAECIKVEWRTSPDSRVGAMAPVGGREARRLATGPLQGVTDPDMGGQFLNKNSGKRGISLNVRDPRGLSIARRLIAISDVVAEGFSPGVLQRWGLGYDELREIKPDIIYAQQTGMGTFGTYGRFRSVGPIAAAFAGTSEMSGLPEPAMPAGWGYSYLDWIGAYSFGLAILTAIHHRNRTGRGQWIDASQCEAGIFVGGPSYLDWSANRRPWHRYGNRSPYKAAAPHGIFPCAGSDSWVAIACFTDEEWQALCHVAGRPEWAANSTWATLGGRLSDQDSLERAVGDWSANLDAADVAADLQEAGVPAGRCQTAADRCEEDPQLAHLQWLSEVTGTKIGTWPIAEVPVKLSATPARVAGPTGRGAPCYGEDNEYVYGELLGMSKREMAQLSEDGVI